MDIFHLIVSFLIGIMLVLLLGWVFSLKTKGLIRILFNSLAGIIILFAFSLFRIVYLPINPLTAIIIGFLGAPGIVVVVVLTVFL